MTKSRSSTPSPCIVTISVPNKCTWKTTSGFSRSDVHERNENNRNLQLAGKLEDQSWTGLAKEGPLSKIWFSACQVNPLVHSHKTLSF